jgi:hypothetical protein
MKILFTSFACICVLLSVLQPRPSGGWKGIVPLHSARVDVERLLGPSKDKCQCFYETEDEKIFVHYADSPCEGFLHGWDVAKDAVLMITVRSNAEMRFSDLSVDLTKFVKTLGTDTPKVNYTDKDAGVRYEVSDLGMISAVDYVPKRTDYNLRCKGFPSIPDLGLREFKPFDEYSNISPADEYARLDNFSILLHDQPEMKGYILVYASKDLPANKARMRARNAKNYLVERRNLEPKRIDVIEGGYREQFDVELYILPSNGNRPTPYPTVVPPEFEVNKNDKLTTNRRASNARIRRGKRLSSRLLKN